VDIFWSYALGAGYAVAAARHLKGMEETKNLGSDSGRAGTPFINKYFVFSLFYAAVFFAPSGVYLLWRFTSWETMHVWDGNIEPLLVAVFAITNVTQSILGFWMACRCIKAGNGYRAYLHMTGAYFLMFFILVHGWDGSGYRRFFSATPEEFQSWKSTNVSEWFSSDVAVTLYVMGLLLIPALLFAVSGWIKNGCDREASIEGEETGAIGRTRIIVLFLVSVFVCSLGSAIICSFLIRAAGWVAGIVLFAVFARLLLTGKRKGLCRSVYSAMTLTRQV
jgi:hypothetical protein